MLIFVTKMTLLEKSKICRTFRAVGHLGTLQTSSAGASYNLDDRRCGWGLFGHFLSSFCLGGWSGGAKVLGKLPVPGRPTILITVGQGPTALAVGAGGGCLDIFTLIYPFSSLSPSLWETTRYRLKYCLKGSLSPNTTNQPTFCLSLGDGPI